MNAIENVLGLALSVAVLTALATYSQETLDTIWKILETLLQA